MNIDKFKIETICTLDNLLNNAPDDMDAIHRVVGFTSPDAPGKFVLTTFIEDSSINAYLDRYQALLLARHIMYIYGVTKSLKDRIEEIDKGMTIVDWSTPNSGYMEPVQKPNNEWNTPADKLAEFMEPVPKPDTSTSSTMFPVKGDRKPFLCWLRFHKRDKVTAICKRCNRKIGGIPEFKNPPKCPDREESEHGIYKAVGVKDAPEHIDRRITAESISMLADWADTRYPGYEFVSVMTGVMLLRKKNTET